MVLHASQRRHCAPRTVTEDLTFWDSLKLLHALNSVEELLAYGD